MTEARIVCDPNVLCGKPVIAGTRISVELILEELGAGTTVEELLVSFPHITREAVFAALRYAAHVVHTARVSPAEVA